MSTEISRAAFLRGALAAGLLAASGRAMAAAEPMRTRPIPSTGEALPVVGLGTWQVFDVGKSARARLPLREVLEILFESGGTVVDSSPMYGPAEGVAGDLLAELGKTGPAFIATKVWTEGRARGIAQMRDSMRLFRTDTIDLMQIHNLVDWETQLSTLRDWKAAGTVRYLGITHYTPSAFGRLEEVMTRARPDFVQLPYSIVVRDAERRLLNAAAANNVAVLVNRPYEGGGLFRKTRNRPLPDWAAEFDCESWGQFFLKYLLGHPAVSCVIPGTARPAHMRDNAGAGRGRLPDADLRARMAALVDDL